MISRRGFLTSLAAIGVVPFAPIPDPVPLKFHPKSFVFLMDPWTYRTVTVTVNSHYETSVEWPSADTALNFEDE